ncbi:PP2C family protein-serine/threonine phosphatase [Desulfuromonas thiophila]|uniref:Serine/threonine protein phosphatase PrpC n=1 Tax=Desulfuromonas thiophila TaxID=57664 RepID=A0A1G7DCY6_9BACT|nr:protein phosphatase 2C domain-containing protein [Desulfuromonas thiophila]SDE49401.1 Serine/threonine protein phosphatase PrpC [Desulfuromonas thiophila]
MLNDRLIRWFSRPTAESGGNLVAEMPVFLTTDVGLVREENQDRVAMMRVHAVSKPFVVLALVDGMGGMRNGSECAVRAMSAFLYSIIRYRQLAPAKRLEAAAHKANEAVYEYSKGAGGATLSTLLVGCDHPAMTLNVGDSRIYATVADNNEIKVSRLTVDDSLEEAVGGQGKELLQFIGMGKGLKAHIDSVPDNAKRLLVTSDGVHFIRQESLSDVLINAKTLPEIASNLVTLAKWGGAPDNASLAVTQLPELIQSLSGSQDTGVEVWDSFSALHVMWLKPDQAALPPAEGGWEKAEKLEIVEEKKAPEEKPVKKPRKPRGKKKETPKEEAPQLTFEIDSKVNPKEEDSEK